MTRFLRQVWRYAGALAIVLVASLAADLFSRLTGTSRLTSIFLSSVLLTALYLVDPPYKFSLGSVDEFNSLALFLAASIFTCLLAGRVRDERRAARDRSRTSALLLDATRALSATAEEPLILERLAKGIEALAGAEAVIWAHDARDHQAPEWLDAAALRLVADRVGHPAPDTSTLALDAWRLRPLVAGDQCFGVVGWMVRAGQDLSEAEVAGLEILTDTAAGAIARIRLGSAKTDAEARARTEALRNALLSSVSHDLRTPLAAIMGSASSLRRFAAEFDVATRRDLAANIEGEAARLNAFVSNLLQMSRLDGGAMPLARVAFGAPQVVRATLKRFEARAATQIETWLASNVPEALGDPALFEQALGNVIENSLLYAGPDAKITVGIQSSGPCVTVTVCDDGPGVAQGDLERIFEKFFRADARERVGGTGLGLAISRALLEGMGGSLRARRRPEGGLCMDFKLLAAP